MAEGPGRWPGQGGLGAYSVAISRGCKDASCCPGLCREAQEGPAGAPRSSEAGVYLINRATVVHRSRYAPRWICYMIKMTMMTAISCQWIPRDSLHFHDDFYLSKQQDEKQRYRAVIFHPSKSSMRKKAFIIAKLRTVSCNRQHSLFLSLFENTIITKEMQFQQFGMVENRQQTNECVNVMQHVDLGNNEYVDLIQSFPKDCRILWPA
eukprot:scaffold35292_cov22-Prasinocladus_malaysianus.AAC.1